MGRAEDLFKKIVDQGIEAINELIETQKSEEFFLDFKRSSNAGSSIKLSDDDRESLARVISGFGNSEGGIVVWGIDCSKNAKGADIPHTKYPIEYPERFASLLGGAISGCTVPAHTRVENHFIDIGDNKGFVVTYVPKSIDMPHQIVVNGKSQYRYLIRSGSNFSNISHSILASMFGRYPQPDIMHQFLIQPPNVYEESINIYFGFLLCNKGMGMAKDIFLHVNAHSLSGENCRVRFESVGDKWDGQVIYERLFSTVSKAHVRLPPEGVLLPVRINLHLKPPYTDDLRVEFIMGCSDAHSRRFTVEVDKLKVNKLCDEYLAMLRSGAAAEDQFYFVKTFLKTTDALTEGI